MSQEQGVRGSLKIWQLAGHECCAKNISALALLGLNWTWTSHPVSLEMFKQTDYLCHPVARPGKQGVQASKHRAIYKDHARHVMVSKNAWRGQKKDAKPAWMAEFIQTTWRFLPRVFLRSFRFSVISVVSSILFKIPATSFFTGCWKIQFYDILRLFWICGSLTVFAGVLRVISSVFVS